MSPSEVLRRGQAYLREAKAGGVLVASVVTEEVAGAVAPPREGCLSLVLGSFRASPFCPFAALLPILHFVARTLLAAKARARRTRQSGGCSLGRRARDRRDSIGALGCREFPFQAAGAPGRRASRPGERASR